MNRGDELECGCVVQLVSVPWPAVCAGCRRTWPPPAGRLFLWPTETKPGESLDLDGLCPRCEQDITWRGTVVPT